LKQAVGYDLSSYRKERGLGCDWVCLLVEFNIAVFAAWRTVLRPKVEIVGCKTGEPTRNVKKNEIFSKNFLQ